MNSSKRWDLQVDPTVVKTLKKYSSRDIKRLFSLIELLPADPYFGDIQKMQGRDDVWRRRVGSYRIFYKIIDDKRVVLVFHVERRTSKTY